MEVSDFVEKPLLEKIQDLLERKPEIYDVAFCVGKEKKIVTALKVILKASSPILEKEFEKWEVAVVKGGDGIPLPEFDPIAFELFVKLTSLDSWSLEILQALNLPLNQILNLLSICRSFEMQKPVEIVEELAAMIMQSFGEYKDTDDFLQLSQPNLKSVLASDDIEINELDVFHAAIRWADFQCSQMEVLPNEEQLRKVIGDCLLEIRFPIMTFPEFTEARGLNDFLTAEENLGVYEFIGLTGNKNRRMMKFESKKLPFKTTPRNNVQTLKLKRKLETNNKETVVPSGISRLCLTLRLISAKNPPIVCENSRNVHWGTKINGFPIRSQYAAVAVGNAIYIFGGFNPDDLPHSGDVLDVFVLNVNEREKKWKKLTVENNEVNPTQRYGHLAVAYKEFVLIFGGYDTNKKKSSNSTYRFNTLTLKWDKPKVTGNVPAAPLNHSVVVFGNEMLIYGGSGEGVTNILHSLHLESFRWSAIRTNGIPPSPCFSDSAIVHNDRFILVFGGTGTNLNTYQKVYKIWSFDRSQKTWTAVETHGTPSSSLEFHSDFVHNGRMYISGGIDYVSYCFKDVFCFDPETFEWKEVTLNGEAPSPRDDAGCVAINDQVFIFGGWDQKIFLDDTHVLQM